jgi:hypothetical protein
MRQQSTIIRSGPSAKLALTASVAIIALNVAGCPITPADNPQNLACYLLPQHSLSSAPYALPGGTVGEVYTTVTVTPSSTNACGTTTGFASTGALPPGLTLNGATGDIGGTPTAAGSYSFTVDFTGSKTTAQQAYTLTVVAAPACTISPPATPSATAYVLPAASQGSAYSTTLTASAGCGALSATPWSIPSGSLPGGVAINNSGMITGTPTVTGTFNFTVSVTGSLGSGTQSYSLTVGPSQSGTCQLSPPATPTAAPYALPDGLVGQIYSAQLSWSAGCGTLTPPNDFVLGAGDTLPTGLKLYSDGGIRGTPSSATTGAATPFTVTVTGSLGSGSQKYTITIISAPPAAPTGVSATPGGSAGQINLTWSPVASANSYEILRGTSPGAESPPPGIATVAATNYTDQGLTSGTKYYYVIRACISGVCSLYSSEVSAVAP